MSEYWAVCQTMPGIEHKVRGEIENAGRGAFLPTYAKTWVSDGKVSSRECAAIPGYVFFVTEGRDWGLTSAIDGVQRVLKEGDRAKRVSDAEMKRMVLDHATGQHSFMDRNVRTVRNKERGRKRKPRPGNRIRKITVGNRTDIPKSINVGHAT